MKIKHTFLLTLVLGLAYAGLLFGYQNGPDPASNGIFGAAACNTANCHVGNSLNAAGGTLTLTGLPTQWTAGQTYGLTVTITKSGASRYGFQLSAVSDTTNVQAGSFTSTMSRVSVVTHTSTAIQYVQHNSTNAFLAPVTSFTVNWTAPASTSAGTVRFNLAANAANGNVQTTGDFIYTRVDRVDPLPATDNSIRQFTLTDRSGSRLTTDGAGTFVQGYTRIQPITGSSTPAGMAIFGYRQNNILVSEAGVPASPLIQNGRLYAEVSADGLLNTGIAVANPNSTTATITYQVTDTSGTVVKTGTFTLDANKQRAAFLDAEPFSASKPVQGSLNLSSNVPISVIALRSFLNERTVPDFLMTTLPVVDTSLTPPSGTQYIPHFADGSGFRTHILLVNPTDSPLSGTVQFYNQGSPTNPGTPTNVSIGGQVNFSHAYTVAARSALRLSTAGTGTLAQGTVRVVPAAGGISPVPLVVFSYKPSTITLSEAGVPAASALAFRMYVELSGAFSAGAPGSIETGFAIANTGTTGGDVTLELFNLDGTTTNLPPVTRALPASGQIVDFLSAFFPTLANPFRGILRITTTAPGISVVGIRQRFNENGSYLMTTTPPTNQSAATSNAEVLFPHIVNGVLSPGNYFTTEFIVFSGIGGQSSTGNLRFTKDDGTSLSLTLN